MCRPSCSIRMKVPFMVSVPMAMAMAVLWQRQGRSLLPLSPSDTQKNAKMYQKLGSNQVGRMPNNFMCN